MSSIAAALLDCLRSVERPGDFCVGGLREIFKTEVQQTALMLHKSRNLLICQQNMLINAVRGHAAELRRRAGTRKG